MKKEDNGDKNADGNINEENFSERCDGDYEAYNPKYAHYSKSPGTHREMILRLAKKKSMMLLVIPLLAIIGLAVGLSVHFTEPEQPTTLGPSSTSIAPTASSMITLTTTSKGISNLPSQQIV